jgi:TolA-binding protein
MGRYEEAIQRFEFYLRTYPDGDRVREARRVFKFLRRS